MLVLNYCVFGVVLMCSPDLLWWSGFRMGVQRAVIFCWNYDLGGKFVGTAYLFQTSCLVERQYVSPIFLLFFYIYFNGLPISYEISEITGAILARDVIYTSRAHATMSVSVCLSVMEVHWVTMHAGNTAAVPTGEVEAIIWCSTNMATANEGVISHYASHC